MSVEITSETTHEEVTQLFDDYYGNRTAPMDSPAITSDDRILYANDVIERYYSAHGKRPPNAVLSRLATYILLDDLSDSHPDKMAREEYPIMSYGQTGRYFARNGGLKDEPYDHGEVIGYIPGLGDDGKGVREALLNPDTSEQRANSWRLFIREILTEREALIIVRTYEDGATQAEIAEELGISQQRVAAIMARTFDKIRKIIKD